MRSMFVRKFRELLETKDAVRPLHVALRHVVCARDVEACGWQGWMLEAAWRAPVDEAEAAREPYERLVPIAAHRCPRCGRRLVESDVEGQDLVACEDPHAAFRFDYDVAAIEYRDDPWLDAWREVEPLGLLRMRWADRAPDADPWHEHCELCSAAFSDDPFDEHEGMSDGLYRWVCLECWDLMDQARRRVTDGL